MKRLGAKGRLKLQENYLVLKAHCERTGEPLFMPNPLEVREQQETGKRHRATKAEMLERRKKRYRKVQLKQEVTKTAFPWLP
jgi:hypothetical protein